MNRFAMLAATALTVGIVSPVYAVNEADKNFSYDIEKATFPNWDGTAQKRSLVITGDELRYSTSPGAGSAGGTVTLTWKRAK